MIPRTATALGHFEEQLEDDDEPVAAVENLEERLAIAAEGADYEIEDPAVVGSDRRGAVSRGQARSRRRHPRTHGAAAARRPGTWHGDPPEAVVEWLADRGVRM